MSVYLIRCYLALHAFLLMLKLLHSGFCLFQITEPGLQKIFTFSYLKTPAEIFFNPYDSLTTLSFKGSLAIFCKRLSFRLVIVHHLGIRSTLWASCCSTMGG